MMQPHQHQVDQLLRSAFDDAWFERLFLAIDRLHDRVSDGRPCTVSPLAPADMVGWLEDIIYTAQETIVEIRGNQPDEHVTEAGTYPG